MECCSRYGVIIAVYLPLIVLAISIVMQSDGRELRPAEHGLNYQDSPPATGEDSAEMLSFFGGPASTTVPLPEARNMSDPSGRSGDGGGRRGDGGGGGGDHLRDVLLLAGLGCGVIGVVLLVVAAFVFLFRFRKQSNEGSNLPPPPPPPPLQLALVLDDKLTNLNGQVKDSNNYTSALVPV